MVELPHRQALPDVVETLLGTPSFAACVTHRRTVPARASRTEAFPDWVAPSLRDALQRNGIASLYRHQRLAVDSVRAGKDTVIVTPTASGKTLCYNLPVLQRILEDPESRAFYLFPTKALSQDQVAGLQRVVDALSVPVHTYTYDGDTPSDARTAIRTRGHIVVTNPDMLHSGILPNHPRWRKVLQDLRYVVIDEMHGYTGVFGSHVANVIRRLRRLCAFYGSDPTFVLCSATIANPREHASRLIGRDVELVGAEENGAPTGPKEVVLYNPPVIHRELGIRAGVLSSARRLATPFLQQGIPTICFTGSRLATEVLSRYLRERFARKPGKAKAVASYRGGYLPGLRREIEKGLRDGEIGCVVSTNALELGIDIGRLDVAILAGYPGSVASLWQQAGRAGRSDRPSLVIVIAGNSPLDQYVVTHPDFVFGAAAEEARIDPDNLAVLVAHSKCALYEVPFRKDEPFSGEDTGELMTFLEEAGLAHRRGDQWHWADQSYPADAVSLRSADPENVVIIDKSAGDRVLAETDRLSAQTVVHEGAIYMVESQPYQVDRLDWAQGKAYVRKLAVDHFTTAMTYARVRVIERFEVAPRSSGWETAHGEVHVAHRTVGYKKVKLYTSENVGYGDVHLPDVELHTLGFWLSLGGEPLRDAGYRGLDVVDGLQGIGRVLRSLASLRLLCDVTDLGMALADPEDGWIAGLDRLGKTEVRALEGEGTRPDPGLQRPTVFIYDAIPGGVGFAARIFALADTLLAAARERIAGCGCRDGCPGCVGPIGDVDRGARDVALDLLDWLTGRISRPRGPAISRGGLPGPDTGGEGLVSRP